MDMLTLDQFAVFLAIIDEGSFAAAARRLNRAQSAITYAIQKLEEQSGVILFDRSTYRPALTDAGRALLPRAQRIMADLDDFRLQARGISEGLEAELTLIIDAFVPMPMVVDALKDFHRAFPLVQIRLTIDSLSASVQALADGRADIGVLIEFQLVGDAFERNFCRVIDLVPVAAPSHPLAKLVSPIEPESLRDHVQLVLTARSALRDSRDFGVLAANCWYMSNAEIKHAMLLGGLGWGSMPRHQVEADLAAGRLVELHPARWEGADRMPRIALAVAHRREKALGPAGRWLVGRLSEAGQ